MKTLAILEGPLSSRVAGCRHVMIVTSGNPIMTHCFDGGRLAALAFKARHFPVGTWEADMGGIAGFPLPRPEILSEIMGTKQKELLV
ncbi:MAG TPA: hypothetical protein VFC07_08890 [Verrucomicrobiae bacterium]|nr:hypothetical protein [Verrucomicrobiae bacterium]